MKRTVGWFWLCLVGVALVAGALLWYFRPSVAEASAPRFARRGGQAVGVFDATMNVDGRSIAVTIWYPALNPAGAPESVSYQVDQLERTGRALRDAAPDLTGGPYPVVVHSHGLGGARLESTYYAEHLASWGFVVLTLDHTGSTFFNITSAEDVVRSFGTRPLEVTSLIDYAEALNASGTYAGLMDLDRLAVSGYSLGGYTALSLAGARISTEALNTMCQGPAAADNKLCDPQGRDVLAGVFGLAHGPDGVWPSLSDPRVKAVVALAPCCVELFGAENLEAIQAPLLIVGGTEDPFAPPATNGSVAFEHAASAHKTQVLLARAGHNVYVDACTTKWILLGYSESCTDKVWDMEAAHVVVDDVVTTFLLSELKGDREAAAALASSAADLTNVTVTSRP